MPLDPEIEELVRARLSSSLFAKWMGIELAEVGDGTSAIRLRVEPHHLNPGGIAHGGVVATLLDAAIGIALRTRLTRDQAHVTAQLSVQYLAPARPGVVLCRGTALQTGNRVGFGRAELFDEDEQRMLATATATFLVVAAPPGV